MLSATARSARGYRAPLWCCLALLGYAALVLLLFGGLVSTFDPAFAVDLVENPLWLASLNAIPCAALVLLLLALTRRMVLSLWLGLLLFAGLYIANHFKFTELGVPLLPDDLRLLAHPASAADLLMHYVPHRRRNWAIAGAVVVFTALLIWKEPVMAALRRGLRVGFAALCLLLAIGLVGSLPPWKVLYAQNGPGFLTWSPNDTIEKVGLVSSLLRYGWETSGEIPAPDRDAAVALIHRHRHAPSAATTITDRPDIVVVQSESFFDPARLHGMESVPTLPHLRQLQRQTLHGDLWVPTYGGGTIRTEFEVLTGIAMRYFPQVQYPYFRLTAHSVPSLPNALRQRGYGTLAIHPHDRTFWNRASALAALGFDRFDADDAFGDAPRQGYFISDEALTQHILAQLPDSGPPRLVFAISMENHGPYQDYPNADAERRAAQPVPAGLSAEAARALRGYLYHLDNADRALGELVAALRQRERRTLLLFYGDHLPALPKVYKSLGFTDGVAPFQQPVPWLLLDTAGDAPAQRLDTASFYLPALLMAAAGVGDSSYFQLLDSVRRADSVGPGWTPHEDAGLGPMMQLRQRGEFDRLFREEAR